MNGAVSSSRIEGQQALVRVWVDTHSYLPLRIEVHDANGTLLDRSEVSHIDYNLPLDAQTFTYTPPPGVSVATFHGGDGAQVKRSLAGAPDAKPAQP